MNVPSPGRRLECAASLVRNGAVFADVGTDHAYLPLYLCEKGVAVRAVASDINDGPCRRACENVAKYGLSDRIKVVRADGLDGLRGLSPTDIAICGMGGELIASMIGRSDIGKRPGVRFILQPMSRPETLRRALNDGGYDIVDERLCVDSAADNADDRRTDIADDNSADSRTDNAGDNIADSRADSVFDSGGSSVRIYCCIAAEYRGENVEKPYSPLELALGRRNLERGGEPLCRMAAVKAGECRKKLRGRDGREYNLSLLGELEKIIEEGGCENADSDRAL